MTLPPTASARPSPDPTEGGDDGLVIPLAVLDHEGDHGAIPFLAEEDVLLPVAAEVTDCLQFLAQGPGVLLGGGPRIVDRLLRRHREPGPQSGLAAQVGQQRGRKDQKAEDGGEAFEPAGHDVLLRGAASFNARGRRHWATRPGAELRGASLASSLPTVVRGIRHLVRRLGKDADFRRSGRGLANDAARCVSARASAGRVGSQTGERPESPRATECDEVVQKSVRPDPLSSQLQIPQGWSRAKWWHSRPDP